ncbi:MAG: site-specific integrase [Oscillospiraceae bacterium]|nr:site-specific integrase [Oscillospiraceae bacterium]
MYKSKSGTWTAEITLGYYTCDGVRKRKRKRKYGFAKKKDALAYILALQNGIEERKTITMSVLWEIFRQQMDTLSRSKRTAYNIAWNKISNDVCYRTIDEFSVPELQELTDSHGNSYYTKRDIKNLLSHLYKIAIRDDYADKNKAAFIRLPELHSEERIVFADSEIDALWNDYNNTHSRITAQMLTMLYTGIRPGELLSIKAENVHLNDHYMTGGIKTKKGKNRKIIIPDRLRPVIEMMMGENRDLIAWYNKTEEFYNAWKEKRSKLGIREAITPYCCRHTYVTKLTALKVSPAMLQELAGHEDYDTTLEYTHLSVADRLAEVNKL